MRGRIGSGGRSALTVALATALASAVNCGGEDEENWPPEEECIPVLYGPAPCDTDEDCRGKGWFCDKDFSIATDCGILQRPTCVITPECYPKLGQLVQCESDGECYAHFGDGWYCEKDYPLRTGCDLADQACLPRQSDGGDENLDALTGSETDLDAADAVDAGEFETGCGEGSIDCGMPDLDGMEGEPPEDAQDEETDGEAP